MKAYHNVSNIQQNQKTFKKTFHNIHNNSEIGIIVDNINPENKTKKGEMTKYFIYKL